MIRAETVTLTLLFTDIEGSTRLWEEQPEAMRLTLEGHDILLRHAIETRSGVVFKTVGDAFYAAFPIASDALEAALAAQLHLQESVPSDAKAHLNLKVRMALHSGSVELRGGDYFGQAVNRVARLLAVGHGCQILLSSATYELARSGLPSEATLVDLGRHGLRDLQQPEQIWQVSHPALASDFPPLRSESPLPNNLPLQLTSFVGREREISELRGMLGGRTEGMRDREKEGPGTAAPSLHPSISLARLLTLTGIGGTGKTRLMLQVAVEVLENYPDGAWLVELAPLTDPLLVPKTVAAAVGAREEPGRTLIQTLTEYLKSKQLLLLLDNCEHLIEDCASLAQTILSSCPKVRILATSRESLHVPAEQLFTVHPLSLPDPKAGENRTEEAVYESEAGRLFVDRARRVLSSFEVKRNASSVAEICRRLDGIPLAIELAAARVRSMGVEQIAHRLDDRFQLLTGGNRTALPRQRTLLAAVDWSYDLLPQPEKALLQRLSAFAGGWILEAAEAVSDSQDETLDLLMRLVEKSLVVMEVKERTVRYRLLETLRKYAREKAQESGELREIEYRHAQVYLRLAEEAEPELTGTMQAEWLRRLDEEHDNLRAALEWFVGEQSEEGVRLAGALWRFWYVRGYGSEGREWYSRVLKNRDGRTASRAKALIGAGNLACEQGDYQTARAFHEESLALNRELGNRSGTSTSLNSLGNEAQARGDHTAARSFFEESLAIRRELGDRWGIAHSLQHLGRIARSQGDSDTARDLYAESLAIKRGLGDRWGIAASLHNLGHLAQDAGDYAAASAIYGETLMVSRELGAAWTIPLSIEDFAGLAHSSGKLERASVLLGAAEALREETGPPLHPDEKARHGNVLSELRAALGEEAVSLYWSRGRAMTQEQAIYFAVKDDEAFGLALELPAE